MLGFELRARRDRLGLNQGKLAKLSGCSVNSLSAWERGHRAIPQSKLLALESVLSRLEAGQPPIPRVHRPPHRKRPLILQAIRQWILSHL